LKVSTNVKIAMHYFENFGEGKCPPLVARLYCYVEYFVLTMGAVLEKRCGNGSPTPNKNEDCTK